MSHTTTTITAPISFYDVQTVLGASDTDEGKLCTHQNINMWAKNKPVRSANVAPLSDFERQTVRYGLTADCLPQGKLYFNQLVAKYMNYNVTEATLVDNQPYTYARPRGDSTSIIEPGGNYGIREWYRITDFNGYRHDAAEPFHTNIRGIFGFRQDRGVFYINRAYTTQLTFVCYSDNNSDFGLAEFLRTEDITNYFLVVEFYNDMGDNWKIATASPVARYTFPLKASDSGQYFDGVAADVNIAQGDLANINGDVHVCIGLQQIVGGNVVEGSSILSPRMWNGEAAFGLLPYYFHLYLEQPHYDEDFKTLTTVGYGLNGIFAKGAAATVWEAVNPTGQLYFAVDVMTPSNAGRLYYAGENKTVPSDGTKLELGLEARYPGAPSGITALTPSNASRQDTSSTYVTIDPAVRTTLHALGMNVPTRVSYDAPEYYDFQLYARTGGSSAQWSPITTITLAYV